MVENVTNELLLEHLKRLQGGQKNIMDRLDRVESRLSAVEAHMATLLTTVTRIDSDVDTLTRRVERIEQRLNLADAPTG